MNLDNLMSYASVNALTRSEESTSARHTLLRRIGKGTNNDSVGSSMTQMIRNATGVPSLNTKAIKNKLYKIEDRKYKSRLRDNTSYNSVKSRLSDDIKNVDLHDAIRTHRDMRSDISDNMTDAIRDFRKKTLTKYPDVAKQQHKMMSEAASKQYIPSKITIGTSDIVPNLSSTRMSKINNAFDNSGLTDVLEKMRQEKIHKETAKQTVKNTVKESAEQTAKTAAKEVAEDATKKTAKGLLESAKNAKIPQIALGVGVTAWLVNKLSDSRGQQSNGQLYGQGY